jgi:isopentenyldiphosphate isomerase
MELWDLYDINREKIGRTMRRGDALETGTYHLVVAVCIFNDKNQMLVQHRQSDKELWPDLWDITAAGSAVAGETSLQAAHRELFEEIGYDADFAGKRPIFSVSFPRGFCDYYCLNSKIDIPTLKLQDEEVQNVKWADRETILQMIDSGKFIPYYKSLIYAFFEMRNANGSHTGYDIK